MGIQIGDRFEDELSLTDLINKETLQRIQDAFSSMTGMAALITDMDGVPVTEGSNFTDFCMKFTRTSEVGFQRCQKCDKFGAASTWKNQKPTSYYCHAGLIDYAAPILAGGQMIGSFIGGQVLTEPPDKDKMYKIAEELEVDPEKFWEAAQKVRILEKKDIENAAQFLFIVAGVLSDMAYGQFSIMRAKQEVEQANTMKSDFLANMSHEIRTPMNAVIGMAEMALREDLPPAARDYIHQIKTSSQALLTIINDILDFSKIESGKMDVIPVEYEPMSIINDIANIAMERLKNKDVELILDISPDIPHMLMGDNIRIKQILLNLVNNAAKFTREGRVAVRMVHEQKARKEVLLYIAVEDTGIGMKQADLEKIFHSFQQVDSKRNRNIEGTGLGLAISRQLCQLMGGNINVESVYEKGSTFFIELPQKVVNHKPSCKVNEPGSIRAMGFLRNKHLKVNLSNDCTRFGVKYKSVKSLLDVSIEEGKDNFLFVEEEMFDDTMERFTVAHPELTVVLLLPFRSMPDYDLPNLLLVRKPLFSLNLSMIFNREGLHFVDEDTDVVQIDFIAPDAEVLIVDDNAINLTVAEGLIEPLRMKVDTAISGQEAIGKISVRHYDIIFMDHMMPELDGVETTHIIRRFHPEYNDVPILALTANAVSGMKEMFLKEGMNDFVPKPIEVKTIVAKIAQWLPVEKIKKTDDVVIQGVNIDSGEAIVVGDLDTKSAIRLLGNEKLFWTVLKDYYRVIEKKAAIIKETEQNEDWAAYTIEVHALKSASKQIGAISLSEKAATMEMAGNARNSSLIHEYTDEMLEQYLGYLPVLAPFCEEEKTEGEKGRITPELLGEFFADMREALDELDMDHMETVIGAMTDYTYEGEEEDLFARLKEAVENIDVDDCEDIMVEWELLL